MHRMSLFSDQNHHIFLAGAIEETFEFLKHFIDNLSYSPVAIEQRS